MVENPEHDRLLENIEEAQRATVWPDTLRAGRSVDEFLWKGDPKPTPIQRAGLLVFATLWSFLFAMAIVVAVKGILERDLTMTIFGIVFGALIGYLDFRLIRNAFRHKRRHAPSSRKRE
jgi:hypothetical protein